MRCVNIGGANINTKLIVETHKETFAGLSCEYNVGKVGLALEDALGERLSVAEHATD